MLNCVLFAFGCALKTLLSTVTLAPWAADVDGSFALKRRLLSTFHCSIRPCNGEFSPLAFAPEITSLSEQIERISESTAAKFAQL